MEGFYFKNREKWRQWLQENHDKADGIWLVYFKKHTKKATVSYDEAVEEALCFGWIDSKINRIDDERYRQMFTPRRKNSVWSMLNTQRVEKMLKEGKMTEAGLEKINEAKERGTWQKAYSSKVKPAVPEDLKLALAKNDVAMRNFNHFTHSQQLRYTEWIIDAKRHDTRQRRIQQVVDLAAQNIKPTMN